MSLTFLLPLILLLVSESLSADEIVCNSDSAEKMDDIFMRLTIFGDPNGKYPTSEAELKETCALANDYIKWLVDYNQKCHRGKPISLTSLELSLKGIQTQTDRFCRTGRLGQEYISWSRCGNYVRNQTVSCWQNFVLTIHQLDFIRNSILDFDRIPIICCQYNRFHDCIVSAYEIDKSICSDAAARGLEALITDATSRVLEFLCKQFENDSDRCDPLLVQYNHVNSVQTPRKSANSPIASVVNILDESDSSSKLVAKH